MQGEKTLLVTGGAGFIGNRFVADRVADGYHVIVLDKLTYAGFEENLSWIATPDMSSGGSWELVQGDICDGGLLLRLLVEHQVDAVIDFAAESHVDNSIAAPANFIQTNIVGCYTLLEACRSYWVEMVGEKRNHFRVVHVSTDEVYGSLGAEGKFSETTAMAPNSPYSASKAAGDHLCRAWYETYDLPVIVTNCSNNYGPRQFVEKLIPLMITNALTGKQLPIYGDGQNIRDWIHVDDHCRGVYLALKKGRPGETYCFGGNAEMMNIDVVTTICKKLDSLQPRADGESYASQLAYVTDRAGHDRRYAIDDEKATRELGFMCEHNFETGIASAVRWYLANQDW